MKKIIALLLALLLVASLTACGGKTEAGTAGSDGSADAAPQGETMSTENFRVLVPDGWKGFEVSDFTSDEEGAMDPNSLQICKDGETELDIFTKPYVQIFHYGPEDTMYTPDSSWYDDVEDLEPMTIGDRTWNGFTGSSLDVPMAVLWTEGAEHSYQLNIVLESSEGSITLDDADFQAIVASIAP